VNFIKNFKIYVKHVFTVAPISTSLFIFFSAASVGLPFYTSKIQSQIIDQIIKSVQNHAVSTSIIFSLITLYITVYLASNLSDSIQGLLRVQAGNKTKTYFEFKVLKKFLSLDVGRYDDPDFKALLQRGIDNGRMWELHILGSTVLGRFFPVALQMAIALSIIISFDWRIAVIIILAEAPTLANRIFFDRKEYGLWSRNESITQLEYFDLRSKIRGETARIELKMYQIGEYILNKIKGLYDLTYGEVQKNEQKRLMWNMCSDVISSLGYGLAIYLTVQHTLAGAVTVGYMTFIFSSIFSSGRSVVNMLSVLADITQSNRYATDVRLFLEVEPLLKTENPIEFDITKAPTIRFENVSFMYPKQSAETHEPILKDINITLEPGQKIGLIGDNGAGKSTFVKLLSRMYDPTQGDIYVNNVNLKNIDPDIWQKYMSVLLQSYANYNFKVKDAIGVSKHPGELDFERVKESAEHAQAHTFINKYEHGYDAQIGTDFKGIKFSGGQSQKMALARTLYRDAPILILDEPTAAVDTESEIGIFKALEGLSKDVTAIFISHDMATIRQTERIIVLDKGTVSEDGTHDELMQKTDGKYKRMYEEQVRALVK
jgi:ATP-binding cassette subfamily B protein